MPKADDVRTQLERLGERRRKAKEKEREIAAELYAVIRQAHGEGVSISEISRRSGLTRQGVRKILAAED